VVRVIYFLIGFDGSERCIGGLKLQLTSIVTDSLFARMSAISSVLLQLCNTGGHVVAAKALYGGTHAMLTHFLPQKCNITTTFVDIVDLEEVDNAMIEGKTSVLYFESISNPT